MSDKKEDYPLIPRSECLTNTIFQEIGLPSNGTLNLYGDPKQPYFLLSEIEVLLGATNLRQNIKSYDDDEYVKGYVKRKHGDGYRIREMIFLTQHGFYRALYTSQTKMGKLFRKFIAVLLDRLQEDGVVYAKNAVEETQMKYKGLIKEVKLEFRQKLQLLEREKLKWEKRAELEHENLVKMQYERDVMSIKLDYEAAKSHQQKEELGIMAQRLGDFSEIENDLDPVRELELIKKKLYKPVYVYLVPYKKIKKLGESEDIAEYDAEEFSTMDKPDDDEIMYYAIDGVLRTNNVLVETLYAISADHLKKVKSLLPKVTSLGEIKKKMRDVEVEILTH